MMKKIFTLIALVAISFSSMAQWLPQASGFAEASRGIKFMHAVSDQIVWATAYDGSAAATVIAEFTKTSDGGDVWTPGVINNAAGLEPGMIFAIDANTAYVPLYKQTGALPQGIYVTTNGGTAWNRQTTAAFSNSASFPNVVHFFDANNGVCQGDPINGDFEIYTTSDGGTTWTLVPGANIPAPVSGEWGVVGYCSGIGDNFWFGTNKGRVYRSADKGMTWEVSATTLVNTYVDVEFADALHGIAMDKGASSTGAMSETFDGGVTWAVISATGTVLTNDYAYVPGTPNTWVCTGAAEGATGIAYSYNGGHTWAFFPDTEGTQFLATDWINSTTGWCGAFSESSTVGGMFKFNGILEEPLPPTNLMGEVTGGNDVHLTWNAPGGGTGDGYFDDFESHEDFSLAFSPWTTVDVDGSDTYVIEGYTWLNGGDPQAFIIFNSTATTPVLTDPIAYSGNKVAACFASVTPANNDWMISPQLMINEGDIAAFFAKSHTDQYGLERFQVGVSTTGTSPADFTIITPGAYVTAPVEAYAEFSYDLSAYAGQSVYIGIQCVSNDAFILLVDDFYVGAPAKRPVTVKNIVSASILTRAAISNNTQSMPNTVRGGDRTLLGYNVWRNGGMIASQISDLFYDDMDLPNGGYSYQVTAVYENGESVPAGPVEIEITGGGNVTSIILDFEAQADFDMVFTPWDAVDLDGSATYGFDGITFPNSEAPMAFIAFNPLTTTPAVTGMTTHGGDRLGACFASVTPPNNDWLISPQVTLGENPMLSMWVKSYTDQYGLEKYNVLVSTTDNNPASFTAIAGPIDAPVAAWTYVEYDLDAYMGQAVYVAIQCISNDAFIFLVDDIAVSFTTSVNAQPLAESLKVYPNPATDMLNINAGVEISNARLYSVSGQLVFESNDNANEMQINTSGIPSGLYLLNITTKNGVITRKVSIR